MKESVSEVLSKIIDSDDTTVGGGSASALSGAMAAGMIAMVAKLSKKKPVNFTVEQYDAIAEECDRLAEQLQEGCVRDTEAYCMIVDAFKLPKGTDEEKAARSAAIQKGLEGCTATPFEMMELAVETLELTAELLGKTNDSAASDLGVSALSLRAAIQGAWLNVLINIGSLKNKELAEDYRKKGEAMLEKALPLADKIYAAVVASL